VKVPDDEDEAGGHGGGWDDAVVGVGSGLVIQRHVCKLWSSWHEAVDAAELRCR
jgi:hypothetical protein